MFQPETMERAVWLNTWETRSCTYPPETGIGGFFIYLFFFFLPGMGYTKSVLGCNKGEQTGSGIFSLVVPGYLLVVGFQKVLCEGTANQHRSPLYAFPFKQVKCGEQK